MFDDDGKHKMEKSLNNIADNCRDLGGDVVLDNDENAVKCVFKKEEKINILKEGD